MSNTYVHKMGESYPGLGQAWYAYQDFTATADSIVGV
jgi:hypothetical protein